MEAVVISLGNDNWAFNCLKVNTLQHRIKLVFIVEEGLTLIEVCSEELMKAYYIDYIQTLQPFLEIFSFSLAEEGSGQLGLVVAIVRPEGLAKLK